MTLIANEQASNLKRGTDRGHLKTTALCSCETPNDFNSLNASDPNSLPLQDDFVDFPALVSFHLEQNHSVHLFLSAKDLNKWAGPKLLTTAQRRLQRSTICMTIDARQYKRASSPKIENKKALKLGINE